MTTKNNQDVSDDDDDNQEQTETKDEFLRQCLGCLQDTQVAMSVMRTLMEDHVGELVSFSCSLDKMSPKEVMMLPPDQAALLLLMARVGSAMIAQADTSRRYLSYVAMKHQTGEQPDFDIIKELTEVALGEEPHQPDAA